MLIRPGSLMTHAAARALSLRLVSPGALVAGMTFQRASPGSARNAAGTAWTAYAADTPRYSGPSRRLLIEAQRTNLVLGSAAPVTQAIAVSGTPYTISFEGTGSVSLSSATGTLVGTGANDRVSMTVTPAAGGRSFTVTGDVRNAQLEAGSFASSYIPTTDAAVIRAVDIAMRTLDAGQQQRGTLVGTFMLPISGNISQGLFVLDDTTGNNRITLRAAANTTAVTAAKVLGGAATVGASAGTLVPGTPFKAALAWDRTTGEFSYCMNGGAVQALAGGLPPFTRLLLGHNHGTALTEAAFGEIGPLDFHPSRLPDAQLQALTA
ncbi:hypothetical protein [Roseomonas sp. WA12]